MMRAKPESTISAYKMDSEYSNCSVDSSHSSNIFKYIHSLVKFIQNEKNLDIKKFRYSLSIEEQIASRVANQVQHLR